jgi:hypothetical protein
MVNTNAAKHVAHTNFGERNIFDIKKKSKEKKEKRKK